MNKFKNLTESVIVHIENILRIARNSHHEEVGDRAEDLLTRIKEMQTEEDWVAIMKDLVELRDVLKKWKTPSTKETTKPPTIH